MKSRVLLVLVLDIYDVMMTQNTIPAPIEQEAPATHSNQQRSLGLAVRYIQGLSAMMMSTHLKNQNIKNQTPDPLFRNNSQKKKKKKTNRREQKTKNAI